MPRSGSVSAAMSLSSMLPIPLALGGEPFHFLRILLNLFVTSFPIWYRKMITEFIRKEPGIGSLFIESICTDPDIINYNISLKAPLPPSPYILLIIYLLLNFLLCSFSSHSAPVHFHRSRSNLLTTKGAIRKKRFGTSRSAWNTTRSDISRSTKSSRPTTPTSRFDSDELRL